MKENKLYAILDEEHSFYCYITLQSILDDSIIHEIIKKLYYDLLKDEEDFSECFEREIKKLENIKVTSISYTSMKYICV